jgi:hypothetical protein
LTCGVESKTPNLKIFLIEQHNMSIIFLHIPKSGGKTFIGILVRHQGYRGKIMAKPVNLTSDQWLHNVKKTSTKFDAIVGHMPFGVHTHYRHKGYKYVTIMREPVDRVISNYCHFLRPGYPIKKFQKLSFEDALTESVDFNNLQTRMLSGDTSVYTCIPGGFKQIIYDKELLNRAKENLKIFAVIGFLEVPNGFEQFIEKVEKYFGWRPDRNYSYNNKAPNKKSRDQISQTVIDKIIELNQMDIELYEWAKIYFV